MIPFQLKDRIITVLQVFITNAPDYTYDDDQEQTKIVTADAFGIDRKEVEKFRR